MFRIVTASLFCGLCIGGAQAECARLVKAPMLFQRASWAELEALQAPKSLNSRIDLVQTLKDTGQGQLNIDQYAITIDKSGQSASQLLGELRANLSEIAFKGSNYTNVVPLDPTSVKIWNSAIYKGSILVFTLDSIAGVMDLETGAVVISCQSDTDFAVSTVKVGSANTYSNPGWHPVSGNRAFGVRDNGTSLTIFVKAADRIVDAGLFKVISNEHVFKKGHEVWLRMIENIKSRYTARNPRDIVAFSVRVDY